MSKGAAITVFSGMTTVSNYSIRYECILEYKTDMEMHYDLMPFSISLRIYQGDTLVYRGIDGLMAIGHLRHWYYWLTNPQHDLYMITDIDVGDEPIITIRKTNDNYKIMFLQDELPEKKDEMVIPKDVLVELVTYMIVDYQFKFHEHYKVDIGSLLKSFRLLSQKDTLEMSNNLIPLIV